MGLNLLWLDDEPDNLRIAGLFAERWDDVDIIKTETRSEVEQIIKDLDSSSGGIDQEFDGLVIDLKLGPTKESEDDGADFAAKYTRNFKWHPTFIYSAYLREEFYKNSLESAYILESASKHDDVIPMLEPDGFLSKLRNHMVRYNKVKQLRPEAIEFSDFVKAPEKFSNEVNAHWDRNGTWIEKDMIRNGRSWMVICGRDVVLSGSDPREFPDDEELYALGEAHSLVPFAYSMPMIPETIDPPKSVSWSGPIGPSDFFPTVEVEILERIVADFDTGAFRTHLPNELRPVSRLPLAAFRGLGEKSKHLGYEYKFTTKKVEIGLVGSDGSVQWAKMAVDFVKDWSNSPFVEVNPNRRGLVGRDIFEPFTVRVTLNSGSKSSHVAFIAIEDGDENG